MRKHRSYPIEFKRQVAQEYLADMVQTQEARIAALERLVGKLVLENEFLKGASRHVRQITI